MSRRHLSPRRATRLSAARLDDRVNPSPAVALSGNSLIAFDTDFPTRAAAAIPVTGLGAGENLVGIDVRPQNGALYGLTSNGAGGVRLYDISRRSGVATPLTAAPVTFTDTGGAPVAVTGTNFGIDFNPTVDRLRVVTDAGVNFRINPNTGQIVDGDTTNAGVQPDSALNGGGTKAIGTAYTNSTAGATVTTQYTLDASTGKLFIQNPPNTGTLTSGVTVSLNGTPLAFTAGEVDIPASVTVTAANAAATGTGFAVLTVNGQTGVYGIDLATGAATFRGLLGTGTAGAKGVALLPVGPTTPVVALANGNTLVRFSSATPGTTTSVGVTGITAGETLVGLDYRPATGQLYALGVNSTTNTGTLYILDPQGTGSPLTAAATVVGAPGSIALVDATGTPVPLPAATVGYGVNFNPAADRLRVVTGTGLNFRVDPNTGLAVDGNTTAAGTQPDAALNGGSTKASGTSYTNSFAQAGTAVTTEYTLDASTGKLFVQNPPNGGTLTNGVTVTLNGAALPFTAVAGFDIPPGVTAASSNAAVTSGTGFAALTVGTTTSLYSIDLSTGAATLVGPVGTGLTPVGGLSVGDVATAATTNPGLVGPVGFAVGSGAGQTATVKLYGTDGQVRQTITPFGTFTGGVRVASADFNGDGVADVAVGTGPGTNAVVRVLDGRDGTTELFNITPFDQFGGGVFVAAGDVNGDGTPDLVVTPDQSGGPRVKVISGKGLTTASFTTLNDFIGIGDPNFRGGARAAVGDLNGDGVGDLVVAAGFGGGPRVAGYDGKSVSTGSQSPTKLFGDFFAIDANLRDGAFVALGDLDGDGKADIVAGTGVGGNTRVVGLSGAALVASNTQTALASFFGGDANNTGGIRVAVANLDGDGRADVITGSGTGAGSRVFTYPGATLPATGLPPIGLAFDAFTDFTGGVFVG
jgi:hypothetical protein